MRNLIVIFIVFLIAACARQGSPSGGPRDEMPPRFLSATPDTLSLNISTDIKEIEINFDEYLILKDHSQNIIISPPFEKAANFQPVGLAAKSVLIKLNEPLKPNTTYNINFGNSIQDNNEGNILPYFQYVFSTGDYIDSLEITGNAKIEAQKKLSENLIVGLYKVDSAYNDSIVLQKKPYYISKADADGNFKLNYLHPGEYQLIAFEDEQENMKYDFGEEKFGFIGEPIKLEENIKQNILLFDQQTPYRVKNAEQKEYGHLVFSFTGQPEEVEITPLDFEFTTSKIDYKPKSDSLNFRFDPAIDSISKMTQRLNFLVQHEEDIDTVSLVYNNQKKHSLSVKPSKEDLVPGRKLKFTANYPITHLDSALFKVKRDSLDLPIQVIRDSGDQHSFYLDFRVELDKNYEVEIFPEAIRDFFQKNNDSLNFKFKTKTRNDFGHLKLHLQGKPEHPFWIQLMNEKDEILNEKYTTESDFEYNYLSPGNYYFRILVDENENEFWDTGDFFTRRQPEKSYVYPEYINIRALWDTDETWVLERNENLDEATVNEESPSEEEDSN